MAAVQVARDPRRVLPGHPGCSGNGRERGPLRAPGAVLPADRALENAWSLTGRVFTSAEHAQTHCQIGNLGLAIGLIQDRVEFPTQEAKSLAEADRRTPAQVAG